MWLQIDSSGRHSLDDALGKETSEDGTFTPRNATADILLQLGNLTGTYSFTEIPAAEAAALAHEYRGCDRDARQGALLQPMPWWTLFAFLPVYNLCSSMKRGQKWRSAQMLVMVSISCVSSGLTRYANIKLGLAGHPDYVALIGSFVVSVLGNLYSRRMGGTAFTTMLTGILLLIPVRRVRSGRVFFL